jgi:hypothetical protein
LFAGLIIVLSMLAGCGGPSVEDLKAIDCAPLPRDDWKTSTSAARGLDPMRVADFIASLSSGS